MTSKIDLDKILGPRKLHKPIDLDATLTPSPVPVREPEPTWAEKALNFLRHGGTKTDTIAPSQEPPRFVTDSLTPNEEGLPSTPIPQYDPIEIKARKLTEAVRRRTQEPYVPDQPAWQPLDPGLRQNDYVPQVTYGENKLTPRGLWQALSKRVPELLRQQGEYYESLTPEQRLAYQLSGPQKGLIRFGEGLAKAVHLDKLIDTDNVTEKALGIPEVPGSDYLEAAGQVSGELAKYSTLLKVTYPLLGKPAAELTGKAIGKVVNPIANRFAMWASTVIPQATGAGAALAGATAINEVLKGKENELDDKAKNVLDSFLFGFVFSGVLGTVKPYIIAARMNSQDQELVREIYPKSGIWVDKGGMIWATPTNHRNLKARKEIVRMIMDVYGRDWIPQTPEMLSSGAQMIAGKDISMPALVEGSQQAQRASQAVSSAVPAALQAGVEAAQPASRIAIPLPGETPPEEPIKATGEVTELKRGTTLPMEERTVENVGKRSVKAYQFENPEVRPFYQQMAQELKMELEQSIKGGRTNVYEMQPGTGMLEVTGTMGIKRMVGPNIERILDDFKASYKDIEDALNRIIKDEGQENRALAKRIELIIDDMLRHGYTDFWGRERPPNKQYIDLINKLEGTDYTLPPSPYEDVEVPQTDVISPFMREEAKQLLLEFEHVMGGNKTTDTVAYLLDYVEASPSEIALTLSDIIAGKNPDTPLANAIRRVLHHRLAYGYKDYSGKEIGFNADYVDAISGNNRGNQDGKIPLPEETPSKPPIELPGEVAKTEVAEQPKQTKQPAPKAKPQTGEPESKLPIKVSKDDVPYDVAFGAFRWTSHVPEEWAEQVQNDYVQHMRELYQELSELVRTPEQKEILKNELERYKKGYLNRLEAWLYARSRTASAAVTGPAKFNRSRNEKALSVENKRRTEFIEWQKKAQRAIKRKLRQAMPADIAMSEEAERLKKAVDRTIHSIKQIESGELRGFNTSGFKTNLANRIKRSAENGNITAVQEVLKYIEEQQKQLKKPLFTKRHSIWKLVEQAQEQRMQQEALPEIETVSTYDGAEIINNRAEERVQIRFDEVPNGEVRNALKREGWRWSRKNQAWQRKNTNAAVVSAKRIIGKYYGTATQIEPVEQAAQLNTEPAKAVIEHDIEQKIKQLEKVAADAADFDLQLFAKGRIKQYKDLLEELRAKGVSEENIKRVQELLKMEDAAEQLKQDYAKKQKQSLQPKVTTAKERKITTAQMRRMFALAKGDEQLVKDIVAKHGFTSRAEVTQDKYEQICNEIRKKVNQARKPPTVKQTKQDMKKAAEAKEAEPPKIEKDPRLGYQKVTAGEIADALGIDIPEESRSEVIGHLFDDKVFSLLDKPITEWTEEDIRLITEEANFLDATIRPGWRTIPRPITDAVVTAKKEANIYADKYLARYKEATEGLTDEEKRQVALILDGKAQPKGELGEVAAKIRTILDQIFNDMVNRGLIEPERYIENYYSHILEEIDPNKVNRGLGNAPSAWMTKQRTGSDNYDLDMDRVITRYVTTVSKNMFIRPVQEKFKPVINEMGPNRKAIVDKLFRAAYGQPQNEEVLLNKLIADVAKIFRKDLSGERTSAEASRFLLSLIVQRAMGLNPITAVRNYTQKLLAIAEVASKDNPLRGFKYFARASKFLRTEEGKEFVRKYNALRQERIYYEFLESVSHIGNKLTKGLEKSGDITMWMFSRADLSNVDHAFLYGVWAALDDGKTIKEAIEYGNKVAVDTQFAYDIRRAPISHGPLGKLFALFTSYAQNFGELFWDWIRQGKWQSVLLAIGSLVAADYLLEKATGLTIRLNPVETVQGHLVVKLWKDEPTVVRDYIRDIESAADKLIHGEVGEWKKGLEEFLYLAPGGNQLKRTIKAVRATLNDYEVEGSYGRTDTLNGFSEAFRSIFGQTVEAQIRWEIGRDYYEAIKAEVDPSFTEKLLEPVKGDLKERIKELNERAKSANLDPRKLFDNAVATLRREYYELSEKAILRDRQEDMKEIIKTLRRLGVTRTSFSNSMKARGVPLAKYSKWLNYLPK